MIAIRQTANRLARHVPENPGTKIAAPDGLAPGAQKNRLESRSQGASGQQVHSIGAQGGPFPACDQLKSTSISGFVRQN